MSRRKYIKSPPKDILTSIERKILIKNIHTYQEYLESKAWKLIRKRYLKTIPSGKCRICKKNKISEVHHKRYRGFGNERYGDLIGLCHKCHFGEYHPERNITIYFENRNQLV